MSSKACTVILVESTSHAIRLEKMLARESTSCKLVPVPRHLSSDCGVCVRIARADRERAERILRQKNIQTEGIHDID